MTKVYVVMGYSNTGSGSLTYPEDFEFEGFYEVEQDAEDHARRLNDENGCEEGDLPDEYDGIMYTVIPLDNLKKKS